jgi:para-aminobenzoate synthetase component 1
VVQTFEGFLDLWRFDDVRSAPLPPPASRWVPVVPPWEDSLPEPAYRLGVDDIRRRIREGEVYQVNLCRVLSAAAPARPDPWALATVLARGNPAPYASVLDVPAVSAAPGAWVVSASPELFLRRQADVVSSSPIKGTGRTASDLLAKDDAENIMIVDLVRNDLQRVCRPGSVEVTSLLNRQSHPGLVHLVSTVTGRLEDGVRWPDLLAALSPPGSVSGAPKSSALTTISALEPARRGPYCGAVGWVDADAGTASLAVGIRTFWWDDGQLHFGTGAGITWESDAGREWRETELKASRLIGLATGAGVGDDAAVRNGALDSQRAAAPGRQP